MTMDVFTRKGDAYRNVLRGESPALLTADMFAEATVLQHCAVDAHVARVINSFVNADTESYVYGKEELYEQYFDVPGYALLRQGISLTFRSSKGMDAKMMDAKRLGAKGSDAKDGVWMAKSTEVSGDGSSCTRTLRGTEDIVELLKRAFKAFCPSWPTPELTVTDPVEILTPLRFNLLQLATFNTTRVFLSPSRKVWVDGSTAATTERSYGLYCVLTICGDQNNTADGAFVRSLVDAGISVAPAASKLYAYLSHTDKKVWTEIITKTEHHTAVGGQLQCNPVVEHAKDNFLQELLPHRSKEEWEALECGSGTTDSGD